MLNHGLYDYYFSQQFWYAATSHPEMSQSIQLCLTPSGKRYTESIRSGRTPITKKGWPDLKLVETSDKFPIKNPKAYQ